MTKFSAAVVFLCACGPEITLEPAFDATEAPRTQSKGAPLANTMEDEATERTAPAGSVNVLETDLGPVTYMSFGEAPKIIGTNDLIPVKNDGANVDASLRSTVDAYGKMSMGCTATYVGNGLALTAGHCFEAGLERQDNVACSSVSVDWGYRVDDAKYLTTKCTVILAMQQNDDVDYAIFRIDGTPRAQVEMDLTARAPTNRRLTIFGHPQLRPLEWSQYCTMQPSSAGGWGAGQFSHQCDTEPGNSGSTILDADSVKIIGIHDGGLVPWNYGTHLLDTPILEILNGGGGGGSTGETYGPFGNNENKVLATYGSSGDKVSFVLTVDTEQGYDFVTVTDAAGYNKRVSGKGTFNIGNNTPLSAPVSVRFTSDSSVASRSVSIRDISVR